MSVALAVRARVPAPTTGLSRRGAVAAVLITALMWGASGLVIDGVLDLGLGVLDLAFWRLAIGGALFAAHAWRRGELRLHRTSDLVPLSLLGVLVVAGSFVVFALALQEGGVSLVNLFVATAPGFLAVGAYVWFRERVGTGTRVLVTAAVVGLGLASWGSGAGVHVTLLSIALGAATTATVVAYTLGTKALLDRYSPVAVSAFTMIIGAAALAPTGPAVPSSSGSWIGVLGLGVGATYAAHLLYLRGLEVLGVTTTALLVSLEAPVALGLAAILAGERFAPVGLVGVALVLASSLLVIVSPGGRARRSRTPLVPALRIPASR